MNSLITIACCLFPSYSVCVRGESGFCCVEYSVCSCCQYDGFTLDASEFSEGIHPAALNDDDCTLRDHISIPQSCECVKRISK